jgi:hypothetical protein
MNLNQNQKNRMVLFFIPLYISQSTTVSLAGPDIMRNQFNPTPSYFNNFHENSTPSGTMVIRLIPVSDTISNAIRSYCYCPLLEVISSYLYYFSLRYLNHYKFVLSLLIFVHVGIVFAKVFMVYSVFSLHRQIIQEFGLKLPILVK